MSSQEERRLVTPVGVFFTTNCYPLQRREVYQFEDGSIYQRDLPFWLEPNEIYTVSDQQMIDQYHQTEERRQMISDHIQAIGQVSLSLASEYRSILGVQ